MTPLWLLYATGGAVIATGLVGGVFLTFSDFVMPALRAAQPQAGIEVMQVINRRIYRSVFLAMFFAIAAFTAALAVYTSRAIPGTPAQWITAGSGIYLVGVFAVTLICNVPMNRRLDAMPCAAPDTVSYWATYVPVWTRWNHVRTAASATATACLLIGFLLFAVT